MIAPPLATSFPLDTGIWISLICALLGLGAALYLIKIIAGYSPGNDTMRRIAGAIEEGAKAYLNRQILSVSVIALIIFFVKHPEMLTDDLIGGISLDALRAGVPVGDDPVWIEHVNGVIDDTLYQ